jgi:protein-S-isoprenylcysteine O-methyltransferase Ste14
LRPNKWVIAGTVMIGNMPVALPDMAGRLDNWTGPRLMVGAGLVVTAFGHWDLLFAAPSTAALATVPRERMTSATGLYNVVRQVMGSIGIALAATTLTHSPGRARRGRRARVGRRGKRRATSPG